MNKLGTKLEFLIQALIAYSLATYFIELQIVGSEHSRQGPSFFLWSERAVAALFTIEYAVRWWRAKDRLRYPFTAMAIVDALAILPFYVGFMVDLRTLRLVRTLRMLRWLKAYRYNTALRNFRESFARVRNHLRVVGAIVLGFVLISSTAIYECERAAQPKVFARYTDAIWWCITTLTTVGYGDKIPITASGRVVATVTVLFGLGVFGTFVSLIGGAFVASLSVDPHHSRPVMLSAVVHGQLVGLQRRRGLPVDGPSVDRLVTRLVEDYVTDASIPDNPPVARF